MPTLFGQGWGTASQTYLSTELNSLASGSAITGAVLNLSALTLQDVLIFVAGGCVTAAADPKVINWFAAGSVEGGSAGTFSGDVAAGTTYTSFTANVVQYPNVRFGMPVAVQSITQVHKGGPFSLAALFGYVLPAYVILGVHNNTGSNALLSSGNYLRYQTVHSQA